MHQLSTSFHYINELLHQISPTIVLRSFDSSTVPYSALRQRAGIHNRQQENIFCSKTGLKFYVTHNTSKIQKVVLNGSMGEYKLYHFNTRFLAEPIRFIFAYCDIPFEDNRISLDDWRDMKAKGDVPWSQLPYLELPDGRALGQSSAIVEYLAKKFDLVGDDDWDKAKCNEVSDSLRDMRQEWRKVFFQKNRDRKIAAAKTFMDEVVPKYFSQFTKMIENSGGKYLVCDRLTYADILFAHNAAFFEETVKGDMWSKYPELQKLKERIHEIPRIKQYIEVRTKTDTQMLSLIPTCV